MWREPDCRKPSESGKLTALNPHSTFNEKSKLDSMSDGSSDSPSIPEVRRAAVGVITRGAKLLTIKRSKFVRAPSKFCFPGGSVEAGETVAEALVREMKEELSIDVVPIQELWTSVAASGCHLHWWAASLSEEQSIEPNELEVESYDWLTVLEIRELRNLLPSNSEFFRAWDRGEFTMF